jgi:uncharacterized protein (UPF0332 family)
MITKDERKALINYRLNQALESISEVELLIKFEKYRSAVNRIYYGMFYCLLALGLKYEFETSKHQQLIGWFNKNFIHTQKVEFKYGQIVRDAFKERQKGDYEVYVEFTKIQVDEMFENLKDFIKEIEKILLSDIKL